MNWFKPKRIYLDYASATPVLPEVRQVMEKYWSHDFYNPSAIYKEGLEVKKEVEECRVRLGRSLGVTPAGIIFTSSGTESDNLAILGSFEEALKTIKKPHVIISSIEHSAVVAAAQEIVRRGGEMSVVEVDKEGVVTLEMIKKLLKKNTFLISIGLANNEIGTIQPISKIGRLVSEFRKNNKSSYPYLHTDASTAPSYLNVDISSLQADFLTLDGSKIYGPKGVGVLALRRDVKLRPLTLGGGQEGGRRAGTLNPALISGFTQAFEIAMRDRAREASRLETFRKYFIEQVTKHLPKAIINGSENNHLPNIVSVSLPASPAGRPGTLAELILLKLDQAGVMVSVGSACSLDERVSGSPVITALGKKDLAESTLRFSFGRFTTVKEFKEAVKIFCLIGESVLK